MIPHSFLSLSHPLPTFIPIWVFISSPIFLILPPTSFLCLYHLYFSHPVSYSVIPPPNPLSVSILISPFPSLSISFCLYPTPTKTHATCTSWASQSHWGHLYRHTQTEMETHTSHAIAMCSLTSEMRIKIFHLQQKKRSTSYLWPLDQDMCHFPNCQHWKVCFQSHSVMLECVLCHHSSALWTWAAGMHVHAHAHGCVCTPIGS